MTTVIAVIGAQAMYLLFGWLISAIITSYLAGRKGYGERVGLASGLIVPIISVVVWLLMPARAESDWKVVGAFGRPEAGVEDPQAGREPAGGPGPTGTAA